MFRAFEELAAQTGLSTLTAANFVSTIITIVSLIVLRLVVVKVINRGTLEPVRTYQVRRISAWVFGALGVLMVGRIWLVSFEMLGTVLGLISAGLAIALRDPVVNIFAWMFIILRRPFELGDRVQVGDVKGDVVDMRLFDFSVMEVGEWTKADVRTGRVVRVPNGEMFRSAVAVYQQGWYAEIWHEFYVTVTFESNWKKTKELLQEVLRSEIGDISPRINREIGARASDYLILADEHTGPQVLVCGRDSGVEFTLRYLCETGTRRRTETQLWERILQEFEAREDIVLAYPTRRVLGATEPSHAGAPMSP